MAAIKSRLFIAVSSAVVCFQPLLEVNAQYIDETELITVTGSRIKRAEIDSPAPVTVISAQEITQLGVNSVDQLLQRMSISAGFAANQTSTYWNSGGYGASQVNLRGIGANRTLVLLNGKRIVNGGSGANDSVDLNIIPVNLIERVEVLKDGASAIYGADAVAGVVNIITVKDFDGAKLDAKFSTSDEGDGDEKKLDIAFGQSYDRWSFSAAFNYLETDAVNMADRVPMPLKVVDNQFVPSLSSSTIGGRARVLSNSTECQQDRINFNQIPGGNGDDFECYDIDKHGYNSFPSLNAVNPVEIWNFSLFTQSEITDEISLFSEFIFSNRESEQLATPGTLRDIHYAANHPTNPTGAELNLESRRVIEGGERNFRQDVDTWRFVVGFEGELFEQWDWKIAFNKGRNTSDDIQETIAHLGKVNDTLNTELCASDGVPCGDYLGAGDLSPEVINYIMRNAISNGGSEQEVWTFETTSNFELLEAGDLGIAFGFEHRKETGWRNPDPLIVSGELNTNQEDPISGGYHVNEYYGEAIVPLVRDSSWANYVELDVALRYTSYDFLSGETNYKLGLLWDVNDTVSFRSTLSTSFRAPSVNELYGGVSQANLKTVDPCSGWDLAGANSVVAKNCQTDGVPDGFVQVGDTILTDVGGNQELEPEEADTFTIGTVLTFAKLNDLNVTIDYFRIEITEAIDEPSGSVILEECYSSTSLSHSFCSDSYFTRNVFGDVDYLSAQKSNIASEDIAGIDVSLLYRDELWGLDGNLVWNITYLDEYTQVAFEGGEESNHAGNYIVGNGSYTDWRSDVMINLTGEDWSFTYSGQFIGGADDVFAYAPDEKGASFGSVIYHNVQLGYELTEQINVRVGVDNLTDIDAPFIQNWTDANTDTMTYDLYGRKLYAQVALEF